MDASTIIPAIDHASRWTWEGWFACSVAAIALVVVFCVRWLAAKHEMMMNDLEVARKEKNELFREIIQNAENTNRLLTEALIRNTTALDMNSRALEKVNGKL